MLIATILRYFHAAISMLFSFRFVTRRRLSPLKLPPDFRHYFAPRRFHVDMAIFRCYIY